MEVSLLMWDPHAFGAAVQQARKAQGLTQEQLGEKVGVTGQAVSKWETGESAPDLALLPGLCATLEVSADALLGTTPSQGFDSLVRALRERLRNLPKDQRTRRLATTVARLLLQYMDERLDAWAGDDFFAVGRHDDGGFAHTTLMTKHGGVIHVQDGEDFPGSDISDDEIASELAAIADPRVIGILRRLVADGKEGGAVHALAQEDQAVRDACDRLVEAGYLVKQRQTYGCTGVGTVVSATILALAAVPGLAGVPRRLRLYLTTGV